MSSILNKDFFMKEIKDLLQHEIDGEVDRMILEYEDKFKKELHSKMLVIGANAAVKVSHFFRMELREQQICIHLLNEGKREGVSEKCREEGIKEQEEEAHE